MTTYNQTPQHKREPLKKNHAKRKCKRNNKRFNTMPLEHKNVFIPKRACKSLASFRKWYSELILRNA